MTDGAGEEEARLEVLSAGGGLPPAAISSVGSGDVSRPRQAPKAKALTRNGPSSLAHPNMSLKLVYAPPRSQSFLNSVPVLVPLRLEHRDELVVLGGTPGLPIGRRNGPCEYEGYGSIDRKEPHLQQELTDDCWQEWGRRSKWLSFR